jgi:MoaA/NifB/PqqE/SkfB family radical SAM enzyme
VHGAAGQKLKKDFMSVKLFEKLIDDLSAFPDKIKMLRVCGNGEPLMNKNILKMLQYAQEKKISEKTELITNGILLTTDLIENLPRFLDRIIISIEGLCSADYQQICNTKINFQNLLDNLGALYSHRGKCIIHIKIHNEAIFSESRKKTFFDMFSSICDEVYIENLVPMWPQLNTAYSTNKFRYEGELIKRQTCVQIFKGVQVQADGEVVPCCIDWKRVNVIGDTNKNSLFEIWNSEKLRKLQIEHLSGKKGKIEPCKDCLMNDCCDFDNIDPYVEECMQRLCRK